jgi:uncharacterized membrane protein YbhN (UPF0104 family)
MHLKKNHLFLILKLSFVVLAFILVFKKTDTSQIFHYIKSVNPLMLTFAYIFLLIAQTASALRMKYYFNSVKIALNTKFCIGLYCTGMLFNTILPGGIGGDGYKVYLVNKLSGISKRNALRIAVSERASGLYVLIGMSFIFAILSHAISVIPYGKTIGFLAILIITPIYFTAIRILLKEQSKTAIGAIPYSLMVQVSGIICVCLILLGLGVDASKGYEFYGYIFLFLVSSIISVLPISLGGIGVRELSFMYGAKLLHLDPEFGVAIAVVYFAINFICSLNGLIFWHKLEKIYNPK